MQNWLPLSRYLTAGHVYEEEAPLLKISSFQINVTERIAFSPSNTVLCVALLETEEDFCFACQGSPTADLLNMFVVFPAK